MPSRAYINFLHIRIDVLKLIETHTHFSQSKRGRKNLGYLTRSAVIMLCAAWERYNEDLLLESIEYINKHVNDIHVLNKEIKKMLSNKGTLDKDEIKPIELTGFGWKMLWLNYAKIETELLNTPKSDKLDKLFLNYLGISNYSKLWKNGCANQIDTFVRERGEIAHNGNKASYIRMNLLKQYQDLVIENVIEIDSIFAEKLKTIVNVSNLAWVKNYSKNLEYYK